MTPNSACASLEVDVSAYGRFHAFRLAAEMERLGALHRLYTSYPKSITGIPRSRLTNVCWLKAAEAGAIRLAGHSVAPERIWGWCGRTYDALIARQLQRSSPGGRGVFHGWASHSCRSLRQAAQLGRRTFLECSCPHPTFKIALLQQEAGLMDDRFVARREWIETVSEECDRADRIAVPSEYTRRSFLAAGYAAEKLVKVPLGVDAEEIRPAHARRFVWSGDAPFRALMVGTSGLRKGAYYLLEAWSSLKLPHAELVIRCDLAPRARKLLAQPGIRHLDPVSRSELIDLYRSATVFCFPSIDDGFGMVVLEAMAAGLPVITTSHVGASELMIDGLHGFTVPIRSVEGIAERIELLYRNPELVRSMGDRARRLACEFTWQRYGASMLRAYQAACGASTLERRAALTA